MSNPSIQTAFCAAEISAHADDGAVPEWVHLLPTAGGLVETSDQRGPYRVDDAAEIIARSMADGAELPIDVNHATDLAAPKGGDAPARGWIKEMEARADGIWGRVEWTAAGRDLIASRAYRAISPVILHDKAKRVCSVLRASLVNRPNLRGLAALNQEKTDMPFQETVAKALGLDPDASEGDIQGAITALQGAQDETAALQSQIDGIGAALGVAQGGDVLAAAQSAAQGDAGGDEDTIVALQAEVNELATQLNALREERLRSGAIAFVDGAIRDKRVGVSNQRDRFIAMHMKDPAGTEELVNGFQKLSPSGTSIEPPARKDGEVSLNAEQVNAARLLGIPAADYAKTLQAERQTEGAI